MRNWTRKLIVVLSGVLVLIGVDAGDASAQNLDLAELGAALVLPVITGGHPGNVLKGTDGDEVVPGQTADTLVTVTNGKSDAVILKLDMISGDPGARSWQSTSFECELTGRETTTFVFSGMGPESSAVYVECSDDGDTEGQPIALFTGMQNGILFVSIADGETGEVMSENVIFGDAVVVDHSGAQAYSFGAISIQAGMGSNDGDKVYRFDDQEYVRFPAVLATNFIAPVENEVRAELLLFTVDGTVGNIPPPRVKLGGFVYNDDEVPFDFSYEFDCFDIVSLEDVNANFQYTGGILGLGSISGHLELVPQPISTAGTDAHDAEYGDGNDVRRRAVHGWLIQNVDEVLVPENQPIQFAPEVRLANDAGPAAWARPLAQSTTALIAFLTDQHAVLDADVLD